MILFSVIVAVDSDNGIGKNNSLPWRLKGDMKFFKETTTKVICPGERNAVIMGKNTWLSIPEKFRPLPDRLNVVLSNSVLELPVGVLQARSLDNALELCQSDETVDQIFVIGGGMLYKEALDHEDCYEVLLTRVHQKFECDVFIPKLNDFFVLVSEELQNENNISYSFEKYKNCLLPINKGLK